MPAENLASFIFNGHLGQALEQEVRFGDFFDRSKLSLESWVKLLGPSASQWLHPSYMLEKVSFAIECSQFADPNKLSYLDQEKLAIYSLFHDMGENKLFGWFGVGDKADPGKNGQLQQLENSVFKIVVLEAALTLRDNNLMNPKQILKPLKKTNSTLESQIKAADIVAAKLMAILQTKPDDSLTEEVQTILAIHQEVSDRKTPLGKFFREIEIADYLETAINAANNNVPNGHILAAEVFQDYLHPLIKAAAENPYILHFLTANGATILQIVASIQEKNRQPDFNQIIINNQPSARISGFEQEKFAKTIALFSTWLTPLTSSRLSRKSGVKLLQRRHH